MLVTYCLMLSLISMNQIIYCKTADMMLDSSKMWPNTGF